MALCALLPAACSGGGGGDARPDGTAEPQLADPGMPGSYGVGVATLTFTRPSTTTGEPRVLSTVVWYPADVTPAGQPVSDAPPAARGGPFPVVMFSHGTGNEPTQATYFTEHLASWGFVVAAPPHPGNTSADCAPCGPESEADSLLNRVDDIIFALDSLLQLRIDAASPLGRIIDPGRTVMTGYSFGGWTAMAAGLEDRFDAIIAMAPAVPALLLPHAGRLRTPVLMMSSGMDDRVDPAGIRELYDALPPDLPRHFLLFPEGGHHAFRDMCARICSLPQARAHELVNRYATAFLEVFVVGDERYAPSLRQSDPPDALISGYPE